MTAKVYATNPETGEQFEIAELAPPMVIHPLAISDPELYRQVWNANHPDLHQEHPPSFTPEQRKADAELRVSMETPKPYNLQGVNTPVTKEPT